MVNPDIGEFVNGSTSAISPDAMVQMMYSLPAMYRNAGTWMMNGTTLGILRTLKDGDGRFLWQPSFQAGQPETILGRPVIEAVDMPDIASGDFPILYGDFSAYRIVDRLAMNQALANTSQRMGAFGRAFAAGAAATGVAAITTQVTRAIDSMAELGAMADRAGLDAEAFQEWSFVAEQNRISIDALTDGFKELNLRTDEFITTGAGPAAEALERLGFTAEELAVAIEDPTALMDDLIDRMGDLDRAARIRASDEIFGGTGGEQFVRLIDQGAAGVAALRQEARDTGQVIDAELIERAEEIDREFVRITGSIRTFFRTVVVEAVNAGARPL